MLTYQAILVASIVLLIAFIIERLSSKSSLPSVVLLIATGILAKPALSALNLQIEGLDAVIPIMGSVGLILIVLEGALDIELSKDKLRSASLAIGMAVAGFIVCVALFATLIALLLPLSPIQATILAIPLSVISSAVAIPSSSFLPKDGREFVVYESSISDILAVMVFFALLESDGTAMGALSSLAGGSFVSLLLASICAVGLTLILIRTDGHIRFVPLLAGMFGLYALGKLYHLSPLIMVLLFGLTLNNIKLVMNHPKWGLKLSNWIDSRYDATLSEFKTLTTEMTFAVRGFFFVLLGYWTNLSTLLSIYAWIVAIASLLLIYGSRYALLNVVRIPKELISSLTWLAPRGLITVLLYLSAKESITFPEYMDGAIMLIVLLSASATSIARLRHRDAAPPAMEANT